MLNRALQSASQAQCINTSPTQSHSNNCSLLQHMSSWPIIIPVLLPHFVLQQIICYRQHMFKWDLSNTHRNLALVFKYSLETTLTMAHMYYRVHHYRSDALPTEILMSGKAEPVFVINVSPLVTKLGVGWGRNGGNSWCTVGEVTGFSIDLICNCCKWLGRIAIGDIQHIL